MEQPELVIPLKARLRAIEKANERQAQRELKASKKEIIIDKEKITDDLGKEINFRKVNGDHLRDPFYVKAAARDLSLKKTHSKRSGKSKSPSAERSKRNGGSVNHNSNESLKLPGQSKAFAGRPVLQDHYHEIIPSSRARMPDPEIPRLVSKLVTTSQPELKGTVEPNRVSTIEFLRDRFKVQDPKKLQPTGGVNFTMQDRRGQPATTQDGGSYVPLQNQISLEEFNRKFNKHSYEVRKQNALSNYLTGKPPSLSSQKTQPLIPLKDARLNSQSSLQLHDDVYIDGQSQQQTEEKNFRSAIIQREDTLPKIVQKRDSAFRDLLVMVRDQFQLDKAGPDKKSYQLHKEPMVVKSRNKSIVKLTSITNAQSDYQTESRRAAFSRKNKSMIPKYIEAARQASLHLSPSHMKLNIKDSIFKKPNYDTLHSYLSNSKTLQPSNSLHTQRTVEHLKTDNRVVGTLSTPMATQIPTMPSQGNIQSIKRNMINYRKFSNSGLGGHYRKISAQH